MGLIYQISLIIGSDTNVSIGRQRGPPLARYLGADLTLPPTTRPRQGTRKDKRSQPGIKN